MLHLIRRATVYENYHSGFTVVHWTANLYHQVCGISKLCEVEVVSSRSVLGIISSLMQDRHTKIRRSHWQRALWTAGKNTQRKNKTNIINNVRLICSTTGPKWNSYLNRHKVDIDELEGSPNFPVHLQSSPVTSFHFPFKVLPPFSLRTQCKVWISVYTLQLCMSCLDWNTIEQQKGIFKEAPHQLVFPTSVKIPTHN